MSGSRVLSIVVLVAVTLGAVAFPATLAEAQSQGNWKKDWNVRCSWTDRLLFEATMGILITLFLDMDANDVVEELAEQNCDDSRIGMAWLAREEFRASSYWLEGLGFDDPIVKLAPDDRKYLAWLDQHYESYRSTDTQGNVVLLENGFYRPSGDIVVTPPIIRAQTGVEAHEQFHGVQNRVGKEAFEYSYYWWYYNTWVWEGTARAENLVWALKANHDQEFELRYWNAPLYWIPDGRRTSPAYATAPFWIDVGRQLRSDDYIAYMQKVFEKIGEQGTPAQRPSMGTLKAVDDAIEELLNERGIYRGGLAWSYPEFIRYQLDDLETARSHFSLVRPLVMALPSPFGRDPLDEFSYEYDIAPIATNAHKIITWVPPGRVASLRIEVSSPDDDQFRNLHLIVNDRRYDRKPDIPDPNWERNVFATTISGSDRHEAFFVRVANVGSPAEAMEDTYTLKITLQSNEAHATVTGGENTIVNDGVLFSYVNINRDPNEMARSMQTALIDRYADHAGLSDDPDDETGGAESREIIAEVVESELGPAPEPPPPGAGRSAVTEGAECVATITIFDDETRSVAKMFWRGSGPFLGATHDIEGSFATGLHDSIYATVKTTGQELTMLESPEALSQYMEQLQGLSVPGLKDAMIMAGDETAAAQVESVLGGLLGGIDATPSREGQVPAPNPGQEDFGRSYDEFSKGSLTIDPSFGDRIVGRFDFTAVDTEADKSVNVEGMFTAIPRPLTEDNLWNGCELMQVPEEDNGDIKVGPAVYPPGIEDEELEEKDICKGYANIIACICALSPLYYPELCLPGDEQDCVVGEPIDTVFVDWYQTVNERGEPIMRRTIRTHWPVIQPPSEGGKPCPEPVFRNEERPVEDEEKRDCVVGEPIDTVVEDWYETVNDDGERVERRLVLREWPVIHPPLNGGKRCPEAELVTEERPVSEECVDCVAGGMTTTVVRDWHIVEIGGKKYWSRTVRTDWEILEHPNHCGRPCPKGGTKNELRPVSDSDDGAPGEPGPGDGGSGPGKPPGGGDTTPPPPGGDTIEIGPKLILDFLEEGEADIKSAPQQVKGSASIAHAIAESKKFKLSLDLSDSEVASCGFNQSVRMGLKMMSSGRTLGTKLDLDAAAGQLSLALAFDQGDIRVSGGVALSMVDPTTIRGDVSGGTFDLTLRKEQFKCKDLMDFSFTLTEVP